MLIFTFLKCAAFGALVVGKTLIVAGGRGTAIEATDIVVTVPQHRRVGAASPNYKTNHQSVEARLLKSAVVLGEGQNGNCESNHEDRNHNGSTSNINTLGLISAHYVSLSHVSITAGGGVVAATGNFPDYIPESGAGARS